MTPCNGCGLPPVFSTTRGQTMLTHAAGTSCAGRYAVITNSHDDPDQARANMLTEWNALQRVPA